MLLDNNVTRHLCAAILVAWLVSGHFSSMKAFYVAAKDLSQSPKNWESERERAYHRQQFANNFRDLQLLGQNLLKEHEANRLTSERLAKDSKSINKCAKALLSLTALGSLAPPPKIKKDITTPKQYDESIRRLAKHIWDFAHNPHLQNNKVFDTEQAKRAQSDLLAIIDLSKAIESKAKGYSSNITQIQYNSTVTCLYLSIMEPRKRILHSNNCSIGECPTVLSSSAYSVYSCYSSGIIKFVTYG